MVALLKLETHNATLKYGSYVPLKQDAYHNYNKLCLNQEQLFPYLY